jgi:hypothetical protein
MMTLYRNIVYIVVVFFLTYPTLGLIRAQNLPNFDPVSIARLRAGEVTRVITGSPRDESIVTPPREQVFETALLLQAGLRALLPVEQREGVALPGSPSSSDPPQLVEAQENYKSVFESGLEATPAQKRIAVNSIRAAADQLAQEGYMSLSEQILQWMRLNGYIY